MNAIELGAWLDNEFGIALPNPAQGVRGAHFDEASGVLRLSIDGSAMLVSVPIAEGGDPEPEPEEPTHVGTDGPDRMTVDVTGLERVFVSTGDGSDRVILLGAPELDLLVRVETGSGSDWVNVKGDMRVVALLGPGDDFFRSSPQNDSPVIVLGEGGRDRIFGGNADDILDGGEGDDLLSGRKGDDVLLGGSGNDLLLGGGGDDDIFGGEGSDFLFGGHGDDLLWGSEGNDWFLDFQGKNFIKGDEGDDRALCRGYVTEDTELVIGPIDKIPDDDERISERVDIVFARLDENGDLPWSSL